MIEAQPRELERARRLERGMIAVRWFGVVFALFQVWQTQDVTPKPSSSVTARGFMLAGILAVGNLLVIAFLRRATTERDFTWVGLGAFALDIAVVFALTWNYSHDVTSGVWVITYVLPLEGALRYQTVGALVPVGLFAMSEPFRQVWLGHLHPRYDLQFGSVTFRVGIGAIIALVAGFMSRSLRREAARAIDRATAAEEAAQREAVARRELDLFHSAVLAGVAEQDIDLSLQSMAFAIAQDLGFDACGIVLLEEGVLRAKGIYGFPIKVLEWETKVGEGVVGRVAQTGQALLVADVRRDSGYIELDPETKAEAAVPLKVRDEIIGVLNVENSREGSLDESTLELMGRLADQIAFVVHSANLRAKQKETLQQLQELDRMKSDFVAITSHELRTPLTAIRGFIKTMLKNFDRLSPSDMQDFLTIVDRQSHRLSRLVEDLLMVSRIEAGELTIQPEPVAPVSFLANLLASFGENAERIKLRVDGEPPHSMVVDPYRVEQILRNLLHNALKFSPPSTPVTLAVRFVDDEVEMCVIDRGIGISAEEQEKVFERFHQATEAATRQAEGAGLGLYITKRLVEAMGGTIDVQSEIGRGSTFIVRIPLRTDDTPSILDIDETATPVE